MRARVSRMQLEIFSSRMWSHVSSEIPSINWGVFEPALFTRISTRPMRDSAAWARASACLLSAMSAAIHWTRTLKPAAIPAAAAFNWSSCRLQMTTSAPAVANARAIAAPRPLLPPVTNAIRPERSNSLFCIIHPRVEPPVSVGLRPAASAIPPPHMARRREVEASWHLLFRARLHLHGGWLFRVQRIPFAPDVKPRLVHEPLNAVENVRQAAGVIPGFDVSDGLRFNRRSYEIKTFKLQFGKSK